jgi:hypothetical protein
VLCCWTLRVAALVERVGAEGNRKNQSKMRRVAVIRPRPHCSALRNRIEYGISNCRRTKSRDPNVCGTCRKSRIPIGSAVLA